MFVNKLITVVFFLLSCMAVSVQAADKAAKDEGYEKDTILKEARTFFGKGAKGLADVISKVFEDKGKPVGYIKGEEAGGAVVVGLRYGKGKLVLKNGATRKVYWQGPSLGIDVGGNVSKVFILVYNIHDPEEIFQRFPGVDGSLYYVAGVGVNYAAIDDKVLAPIRFGVGWRQGLNIGYIHVRRKQTWNPF